MSICVLANHAHLLMLRFLNASVRAESALEDINYREKIDSRLTAIYKAPAHSGAAAVPLSRPIVDLH